MPLTASIVRQYLNLVWAVSNYDPDRKHLVARFRVEGDDHISPTCGSFRGLWSEHINLLSEAKYCQQCLNYIRGQVTRRNSRRGYGEREDYDPE